MFDPLNSMAVLPVITSLTFLFRAGGVAYSEVVIAMIGKRGSYVAMRNFVIGLTTIMTGGILLIAATPLGSIWFGKITGLSDELLSMARTGLWFALLLPGLSAIQSWFQGMVMHHKKTNAITEAVILYLIVTVSLLFVGVAWGQVRGLYVALFAMTAGEVVRTGWLAWRSRTARALLRARDCGSSS
jgi:Na+-driven multidrug efflux pump